MRYHFQLKNIALNGKSIFSHSGVPNNKRSFHLFLSPSQMLDVFIILLFLDHRKLIY